MLVRVGDDGDDKCRQRPIWPACVRDTAWGRRGRRVCLRRPWDGAKPRLPEYVSCMYTIGTYTIIDLFVNITIVNYRTACVFLGIGKTLGNQSREVHFRPDTATKSLVFFKFLVFAKFSLSIYSCINLFHNKILQNSYLPLSVFIAKLSSLRYDFLGRWNQEL